ncbi:MAG: hypothetical protein O3A18_03980 [Planctomycetota bacterium]|nr:hypothetical protein [Planctomycetota bacterium]
MRTVSLINIGFCVGLCLPCAAQQPAITAPPIGTFVRPVDGIESLALDEAWAAYEKSINESVAEVQLVFASQLKATRDLQNLLAFEQAQAARQLFEKRGILPRGEELKTAARKAAIAFRTANAALLEDYDDLIGRSMSKNDIPAAQALRDERGSLQATLGFPPIPNVPEPLFDGKKWNGWGGGWGGGGFQLVERETIRFTAPMFFAYQRLIACDFEFEGEVRRRTWPPNPPNTGIQFGYQNQTGGLLLRIPARDEHMGVIPGSADVIHWDDATKTAHVLKRFKLPRNTRKWRTVRVSRTGNFTAVSIDGVQVVGGLPVPQPLRGGCRMSLGVLDGEADFKDLMLTSLVK